MAFWLLSIAIESTCPVKFSLDPIKATLGGAAELSLGTGARIWGSPLRRWVRGLLVLSCLSCWHLANGPLVSVVCAQSSQYLRKFEQVKGPSELLKSLEQIGIKPSGIGSQEWVDDLLKQGQQILKGMTPEQQKNMRQLAENYMRDRGITPGANHDEALTDLARQFQQQLQDDTNALEQVQQFQKQFEEIQRQQGNDNSLPPVRTTPGVRPDNPLPDNLLPGQVPRDPRSNRNNRDNPKSGNGSPLSPDQGLDPGQNKNPTERPAIDRDPAKNPAQPPPGKNQSESPPTNKKNGSPFLQPPVAPPQTPGERVGVRFDRMLMDAAKKGIESADAETRSQIAGSINSILDHLAKNVDSVVKNHNSQINSRRGRGSQRGQQPPSPFSKIWNRNSSGSTSGGSFSVAGLLSLWPWFAGILFMVAAFWFLRLTGIVQPLSREPDELRPVRYRYSRNRSPEQLVKSVDRFLLARFGRGANWWNVRRAQALLANQEVRRVSDSQLEKLVSAYEQARYTSTRDGLEPEQIESIGEILRELALDLSTEQPIARVQTS